MLDISSLAISRNLMYEIHLRCRRDCAEIAQLPLGCLQVQPGDGARAAHHGGIGNGRACSVRFDKVAEYGGDWRMGV